MAVARDLHRALTSLIRACDAVFGSSSIALAILATWQAAHGDAPLALVIALWAVPAVNISWSLATRNRDRVTTDSIRGFACAPLAAYIYIAEPVGVLRHMWLPALMLSVAVCLSTGIGLRRARRGVVVAAVYATMIVLAAWLEDTLDPSAIRDAAGLLLVGAILSIVAAQLGRTLDDATQKRDEAQEQRARAELLTERLLHRTAEMSNLLTTMDQGFLSMNRDGVLAAERSAVATRLLGDATAGQTLWQALAPHDARCAAWLEMAWQLLTDDGLPPELAFAQMPSKVTLGSRTYRMELKPVANHGTLVDTLVVLTDYTAEVARQRAEAVEKDLLRMIAQMARDRASATAFLDEIDALLAVLAADDVAIGEQLLRDLHTVKGNAGLCGLTHVMERCHALEDALHAGVLDRAIVAEIEATWRPIAVTVRSIFGGGGGEAYAIDDADLAALRAALERGEPTAAILALVATWAHERTRPRLEHFAQQATRLADRLGKGDVVVEIADHAVRMDPSVFRPFWNALGHVVRNAVDHGLESARERAERGKPERGVLCLQTRREASALVVEVSDDGRGIDWDRVREKARAIGRPHATPRDLVDAILSDRLTTQDAVTLTSGRGVGLAAMRDACTGLGGTIEVTSTPGLGTRFCFRFAA